jgi:hypothetical protein
MNGNEAEERYYTGKTVYDEVETKALAIPEQAKLIVVTDNDTMAMADNTVDAISDMMKEVDSTFKPMADKAFAAHREITGRWKQIKQPLEDAKTYLVNQIKGYKRKVQEAVEAEQRRLTEIARKQEEERRLAEAIQAEQEGNEAEAQAIIEEEMFVPTPVVHVDTPKVDNRRYATRWTWKVTDINKVPREYLCIDQIKVNGIVRAMKGQTHIAGIEVFED